MLNLKTGVILATTAMILLPFTSDATYVNKATNPKPLPKAEANSKDAVKTETVAVYAVESRNQEVRSDSMVRNSSLVAKNLADDPEYTAVIGPDGRVYYNHTIKSDELTHVDYDFNVVDTYTFEHNGRVYTNKIVAD